MDDVRFAKEFSGAYIIEKEHLAELDALFDEFAPGDREVSVGFEGSRAIDLKDFKSIEHFSLVQRFSIKSISASKGYRTRSGDMLLSFNNHGSGKFEVALVANPKTIDAFEQSISSMERRLRANYSFIHNFFVSICLYIFIVLAFMTLLFQAYSRVKSPLGPVNGWIIAGFVAIANVLGIVIYTTIGKYVPEFVVNIGEGNRNNKKISGIRQYLLTRGGWAVLVAVFTLFVGWLWYKS